MRLHDHTPSFKLLLPLLLPLLTACVCGQTLPAYRAVRLDGDLPSAYWTTTADMNRDGLVDVVAVGLGDARLGNNGYLVWYEAPHWVRYIIGELPSPVQCDTADMDGDGWVDVVVGYSFGACPDNCTAADGLVSWLRNPGGREGAWELQHIGKGATGVHRVHAWAGPSAGLTGRGVAAVLAAPVVGPGAVPSDQYANSPVTLTLFVKANEGDSWKEMTVSSGVLHTVHDAQIHVMDDTPVVTVTSLEGLSVIDLHNTAAWRVLNKGETGELFHGCSSHDICNKGRSNMFVATIDPFHGDVVSVYRPHDPAHPLSPTSWERQTLRTIAQGGHDIHCTDLDGDGVDEVVAAFRGPQQPGVHVFRCSDTACTRFDHTLAWDGCASTLAIAQLDSDTLPDISVVGWGVDANTVTVLFTSTPSNTPTATAH